VQMEVNDDDENDRPRFDMDDPDMWVRCDDNASMLNLCPVVMATSPDWDRTDSEDDGLRFWRANDEDGGLWEDWPSVSLAQCPTTMDPDATLYTATPESFEVEPEPWVDDHTADDDGLLAVSFEEGSDGERLSGSCGACEPLTKVDMFPFRDGDTLFAFDVREGRYNNILTGTPESFEDPEPEPVSPPPPVPATPTAWALGCAADITLGLLSMVKGAKPFKFEAFGKHYIGVMWERDAK